MAAAAAEPSGRTSIARVLPKEKAARFIQGERALTLVADAKLASMIPLLPWYPWPPLED